MKKTIQLLSILFLFIGGFTIVKAQTEWYNYNGNVEGKERIGRRLSIDEIKQGYPFFLSVMSEKKNNDTIERFLSGSYHAFIPKVEFNSLFRLENYEGGYKLICIGTGLALTTQWYNLATLYSNAGGNFYPINWQPKDQIVANGSGVPTIKMMIEEVNPYVFKIKAPSNNQCLNFNGWKYAAFNANSGNSVLLKAYAPKDQDGFTKNGGSYIKDALVVDIEHKVENSSSSLKTTKDTLLLGQKVGIFSADEHLREYAPVKVEYNSSNTTTDQLLSVNQNQKITYTYRQKEAPQKGKVYYIREGQGAGFWYFNDNSIYNRNMRSTVTCTGTFDPFKQPKWPFGGMEYGHNNNMENGKYKFFNPADSAFKFLVLEDPSNEENIFIWNVKKKQFVSVGYVGAVSEQLGSNGRPSLSFNPMPCSAKEIKTNVDQDWCRLQFAGNYRICVASSYPQPLDGCDYNQLRWEGDSIFFFDAKETNENIERWKKEAEAAISALTLTTTKGTAVTTAEGPRREGDFGDEDYYYTTCYVSNSVKVPEDVEVWKIIQKKDDNTLKAVKVQLNDYTIPNGNNNSAAASRAEAGNNQGLKNVVLLRTKNTSGTITLNANADFNNRNATPFNDNVLTASLNDTTVNGNNFVLANGSLGIGFYPYQGKIPARRGFIPSTRNFANTLGFGLNLDGDGNLLTNIQAVEAKKQGKEETIFDLQGRQIVAPKKGVYVVGGKKVIL